MYEYVLQIKTSGFLLVLFIRVPHCKSRKQEILEILEKRHIHIHVREDVPNMYEYMYIIYTELTRKHVYKHMNMYMSF